MSDKIKKLRKILKGIDQDECDHPDGWWETYKGARFGAQKLKEVEELMLASEADDEPG